MTAATGTIAELTKAFEAANVEMFAVELPAAIVADVTSAVLSRWNATREELIGRSLVRFGTGPLSARHVQSTGTEESGEHIEVTFVSPLGISRNSRFSAQSWVDGGTGYMVLIGQQSGAEQVAAAQQNERRLSLALRSGGYALWDHDYRTGTTYNSPEMFDLLGLERGSTELNFYSFNDFIHPDDNDKTLDAMIREAPFGLDTFQTRYRVMTKSGKYAWIESMAGVIRSPIDGKPAKCVGLSRDIGSQMAAIERLQESERTMRRSQQAARLGSFTIDAASGETRLSQEMIALIGMAEAIVQPHLAVFETMIEPADLNRFREAIELGKIGHTVPAFEIAYKTLVDKELNYVEVNVEAVKSAQGAVVNLFGTCQSITERKMLERKFLQAQKMEAVGQLTGGVAHDFNNLLMVVLGNLQLVEQLVKGDERALKRIRAATDAAEKGSELTKRMLAFSRQQTLQNKEIDVNGLIGRMKDILTHAVGAIVDLRVVPSEDIWPIKADATMLETAILNLCINARDAMKPQGGKLTIETANRSFDAAAVKDMEDVVAGDYVEIIVTDTGCGIARENIEKVFQPFFTTKGPEAGSGLGLSMIYGFAKQSGGHIKIYSEVGHGTAMKIYLPRLKQKSAVVPGPEPELAPQMRPMIVASNDEPAIAAAIPAAAAVKRPIVLIVEDNPSVREVAAAMIEDMGFETIVAASGPEGLKLIEERQDIDLVLSDVIMAGGMNGPEMAMKAMKVRPELKVLFMTGYAAGTLHQMQEDIPNAVDLVNKPFNRMDLTEKVKRALAA